MSNGALQLRQEINLILDREFGEARKNILAVVKNNLPRGNRTYRNFVTGQMEVSPGGTLGNYDDYTPGKSLAGKNLYATGALRDSYYERTLVPGSPIGRQGRISEIRTDSEYAYYYANGRLNSETYHGFDFIGKSIRDINAMYSRISGRTTGVI